MESPLTKLHKLEREEEQILNKINVLRIRLGVIANEKRVLKKKRSREMIMERESKMTKILSDKTVQLVVLGYMVGGVHPEVQVTLRSAPKALEYEKDEIVMPWSNVPAGDTGRTVYAILWPLQNTLDKIRPKHGLIQDDSYGDVPVEYSVTISKGTENETQEPITVGVSGLIYSPIEYAPGPAYGVRMATDPPDAELIPHDALDSLIPGNCFSSPGRS